MISGKSTRTTRRDYYSYRLHVRCDHYNILHCAGRLFQEYVVDAYAQIEQGRLRYIVTHQSDIRHDLYRGIVDAAAHGDDLHRVGNPVILPSSFIGGPRQMWQLYHDAMAIVRARGKPDLFITMTCNPHWPEILAALLPGQTAQDRPDLVARMFKLKLKALLHDIIGLNVFGKAVAHVYVIEFQKRGLPHAHILIILNKESKPQTPEDIDAMVCAEIPDSRIFPELFETVVSCMLHGPCGMFRPTASCMKDGKCTKKYPKPYIEHTSMDQDGYPLYRRHDDNITVIKNGYQFTNRDVVPYNRYLLAKYNCHINVEIATSISAIKYLYKYIYKGHDRASVALEPDAGDVVVNEPMEYLDARYVSASEASWRIFGFGMHHHLPSVCRLPLHLPDEQDVMYDPDTQTAAEVIQRSDIDLTKLTAFFDACNTFPQLTSDLLYPDLPTRFTWHSDENAWLPRLKGVSVGRVYFCPPSAGERYYLRMLLYNVPGPTSYDDLRRYNGVVCETFQQACAARGLLETDDEWDACLMEAGQIQSGQQLRRLFATILLQNNPLDPQRLFARHVDALCDDCKYRLQTHFHIEYPSNQEIHSLALQEVEVILQRSAKSLSDFNLPVPQIHFADLQGRSRIVAEEQSYDVERLQVNWQHGYQLANVEQKEIIDSISSVIRSNAGGLFFIDGPGGTGKTFVESLLLAYVRRRPGQIALAVASSGIASLLLEGGRTSHSRFKIPIDIHSESICNVSGQSDLAKLLRIAKLIVWDEAPAQDRHCFEAVDRTLKDLRQNMNWFGGITMVFAGGLPPLRTLAKNNTIIGDFRQCLPVVPKASRAQIVAATMTHSPFWRDVMVLHLTTNMRVLANAQGMTEMDRSHAERFASWLLQVGEGRANDCDDPMTVRLPKGNVPPYCTCIYHPHSHRSSAPFVQ